MLFVKLFVRVYERICISLEETGVLRIIRNLSINYYFSVKLKLFIYILLQVDLKQQAR